MYVTVSNLRLYAVILAAIETTKRNLKHQIQNNTQSNNHHEITTPIVSVCVCVCEGFPG